ncbi:MAG: hypothetical protein IPH16_08025 [Haliscomenobacter sp.]|nr:hypothetical protein [Haliscomenobacter sp.]MBK7475890.1 hypothetical protein [Haliscomenobacter sp.]
METPANLIESLWEQIENFGKTSYELSKLKILESSILIVSSLVTKVSVILVASMAVLVFNIGIAFFLGDLLGKIYYGFFIVAAFYFFVAVILHFALYKWLKRPVSNLIINQVLP